MRRLKEAKLVYKSASLRKRSEEEVLDNCAWLVPGDYDQQHCTGEEKCFYGERYGGAGTGAHGGGVRVATDFNTSLKGIGCNPLRGRDSPSDYAHGGMSLFECLQELIWGEVFNIALPYGAARVLAVIDTASSCWWVTQRWSAQELSERYGAPPRLPRGIVARTAHIRPAHFMRAPLHIARQPAYEFAQSDVERVRQALGFLLRNLPPYRGGSSGRHEDAIAAGLEEMSRRAAEQSVAAKFKRLIHGNVSASNICMDGAWIDFGSATTVPGWGAIRGYGPFWDDEDAYGDIFNGLSIDIAKHLPSKCLSSAELGAAMLSSYREEHLKQTQSRSLCMVGFAKPQADRLASSVEGQILADQIGRIMRAGYRCPISAHPDEHDRLGGRGLSLRVGEILANAFDDQRSDTSLDEASLLTRLLVDRATEGCADPPARAAVGCAMALRAAKSSFPLRMLYREVMVRDTERLVLEAGSRDELVEQVETMVDSVTRSSELFLADEDDESRVVVSNDRGRKVSFNVDEASCELESGAVHWGVPGSDGLNRLTANITGRALRDVRNIFDEVIH